MKKTSEIIINDLINRYSKLEVCKQEIINAVEILIEAYKNHHKLLVCGNGGSASDSEHIVGELMKGFVKKRLIPNELRKKLNDDELSSYLQGALPAISLTVENALSTAFANDQNPVFCFAQQVYGLGVENDVLLCISTSGNSKNCVYAGKVAKAINMKLISLTGQKESNLEKISDVTIHAPEIETYKIQECHLPIYHCICLVLENEFFEE